MQEWSDLNPGPASARLLYSHPIAEYRAIENAAFGIAEQAPAADRRRLADYRRVVCQKLAVDPDTLSGYYHFAMHLQAHLDRERCEADSLGAGDPTGAYLASARQWGAATRVFDSEMALATISVCRGCQEVSIRRRGDAAACATCAGSDGSAFARTNGTFPPPRPGVFAHLTEAKESALSPVLPYIRVTRSSATSRGVAFGHSFVVPQDTAALVSALPRLPVELSDVVLRGDVGTPALMVNVQRLVQALAAFKDDPTTDAVFRRHGVVIDGADVNARLQEWEQAGIVIPGAGPAGSRRRGRDLDPPDSDEDVGIET